MSRHEHASLEIAKTSVMHRLLTTVARLVCVVAALWALSSGVLAAESAEGDKAGLRPNVVLILADDLGYGDLSCFGAKDIRTPNIDSLATSGTRFTSFCVAQPVCTASRAALMTGCYPNRVSMAGALNHTSTIGLNTQETLLSQLFKQKGYATAIFGKWHLGHHPQFLPTKRGFDEFAGLPYSNDNGPLHPVTPGIPPLPWYENDTVAEIDPDQSQFTRRITDRAVRFIEGHQDQPFFLYVPHIMPHVPIFASSEFRQTSKRGVYGDVVQELDAGVGEVLATLDRLKLSERTLVIFASDNGPFLSYGEHAGLATPLREGKLTTFEGGVRVPCLMRWPKHVPAGRECNELFTTMDLFATLVKLIGAPLPQVKLDGSDMSPLLFGAEGAKGRDVLWYYSGDELHAVRQGDWKLHVPHEYLTVAAEPGRGGKPSNYGKLKPESIELSGIRGIASRHGYRVEKIGSALYNLKDDPGETRDVAAEHPEVVERLQTIVAQARADLGDSLTKTASSQIRPAGDVRGPLPEGVRRLANLEYANHGGKRVMLLDLYLPKNEATSPLPVVMWIHGGGWFRGSKEDCRLAWLAAEGYAVASISYRLSWEKNWPAQIDDCREAVRWLRASAAKYRLDAKRIVASGASAGGHLAALVGTLDAPSDESISSRVQAVCEYYGPSDLLTMPANISKPGVTDADLAKSYGARLLGGIVRDRPDVARQASALSQVTKDDPPFLIIHGDIDSQVPLDQSQRLHARLQELNVPSKLHVVTGAGHGGKQFDSPEVQEVIRKFLKESLSAKN